MTLSLIEPFCFILRLNNIRFKNKTGLKKLKSQLQLIVDADRTT